MKEPSAGSQLAVCIREHGNELVAAECASLTGSAPDADGIAHCASVREIKRAAYVRMGLDVIATAPTLDDLVADLRCMSFDAEAFRIDVVKTTRQSRVGSRRAIVAIADALEGFYPNLDAPKHRFLLVVRDEGLSFGRIAVESNASYRRHDGKPYRTSSSLPSRLARALVNLATPARSIVDPCCGTGSILLEAAACGLDVAGADINPRMVGMSRRNAAHFGYTADVELADARTWARPADAVVTDLPYGRNLHMPAEMFHRILENCARLAPLGIFVTSGDISDRLERAGFEQIERFRVPKYTGFTRYVHRARSRRRA